MQAFQQQSEVRALCSFRLFSSLHSVPCSSLLNKLPPSDCLHIGSPLTADYLVQSSLRFYVIIFVSCREVPPHPGIVDLVLL